MKLKKLSRGLAIVAVSTFVIGAPVSNAPSLMTKSGIHNVSAASSDIRYYTDTVKGVDYSLTINTEKVSGRISDEHIKVVRDLFFEVYPQLYDRFGAYRDAPTDITISFVADLPEGVAASTGGDQIECASDFLSGGPDYDRLTHELAHITQNGWDGNYLQDDGFVEAFADYCRYIYACKDGKYNDQVWNLEDTYYDRKKENGLEHSVRFLVWLDYETHSSNKDIIRDYFEVCSDRDYKSADWPKKVWPMLFKGTKFKDDSIGEVWQKYLDSDFSHYDSMSHEGRPSEIIRETKKQSPDNISIRELIKNHSFSQSYEDSLK
ncbi:MAG: hypothetical protein IKS48_06565 [Eubacterium sp.]|nr:hypothetical protein [Eubacterium sp.]